MGFDLFHKLTNPYERKARLAPAVLALTPIVGIFVGQYGVALDLRESVVGLLATFGLFYLLTSIAREAGKRIEDRLYASWGGKPSTQLLRHRDGRIDPITKGRYHAFLAGKLATTFPDAAAENKDDVRADQIYEAGAMWLLEPTRDRTKFGLLFNENVSYGFRRNGLGLKPLAIAIAVGSILWTLTSTDVLSPSGLNVALLTTGQCASIGVSVVALAVWSFFFTEQTVRTAAFDYADMLLRACDVLAEKRT